MNNFRLPANLADRLGWVLVHSTWQFALVALLLLPVARRSSAASRYWLLLLVLAVMVASPVVTLFVMPVDVPMAAAADQNGSAVNAERLGRDGGTSGELAVPFEPVGDKLSIAGGDARDLEAKTASSISWQATVDRAVRPWLSMIVGNWGLGVLTFAWRPLLSWHTVRRLRTVGVSPVPAAVEAMLKQTAERLRLRPAVRILQSTLTRSPLVIGYLRPVILLPVSVIAGIPASQLEAILAHELAHVRRHDFLVNLLQTLVETVFFYHPAVWWLSHRIRIERENCCDDLAVAAIGSRVEYGRALLAIEELRGPSTALALGIRGGSLLDRVRRLFSRDPAERSVGVGVVVVSVGLLVMAIIAAGVWNSTLAEKPHSPDDEQTAREAADEQAAWFALDDMPITVYGPASNRRTLRQQLHNLERANFPLAAVRGIRQQLEARAFRGLLECAGRSVDANRTTEVAPRAAHRRQ